MRRLHLALLALPLVLGACSITDSISQQLNTLNVKFSSADTASSGPSVGGPSITQATLELAPSYLGGGGESISQVEGEYYLVDTFFVNADNSGNSQAARFGTSSLKPVLLFRINDPNGTPIADTIPSFSIPANQVTRLSFPVKVPLTSIPPAVLDTIIAGHGIPFYLSGTINFDLVTPAGDIQASSQSELQLASGTIPTRPGSVNLSTLATLLKL